MKDYFNAMKGARRKSSTKLYRIFGTLALGAIGVVLAFPLFKKEGAQISAVPRRASISVPVNPHLTQLIDEYETEMGKLMERSRTPGAAIAIVKDSSIVYLKGLGLKASNGTDSVDINTAFRIASVSKCFASFLTGIMVEDGVLGWDDPVVRYMPDFQLKSPEQTAKLNVSHVLSHTTGLPYHTYTNMIEEGLELPAMLSMLKDVNLSNDVGKEYSYQNVAYSLIGEVIKNASHSTYEQAMREKVFVPLKMENASMDYPSLMSNDNVAKPHKMANRSWVPTRINNTYYNVAPAGGVNASIQDMARWMVALLGHRPEVIGQSTLQHLYSPAVIARSKNRNFRKYQRPKQSYYGLGWRIIHYPQDTIVYHGGYVTGFRSEVGLNPNAQVAVCILANAPGELPDNGVPLFFSLFAKYRDRIKEWDLSHGVSSPKTPL
jgi:beta-lactamase class C